jgi:hypothetical protein
MQNKEIVFSVLGAGAMIAVGLYLGLRQRPSEPPGTVASGAAPGASITAPIATPQPPANGSPVPVPTLGDVPKAEQARVETAVRAAIEKAKPGVVEKCWKPSFAKTKDPASIKLHWNGTIGIAGEPTSFGFSEDRKASRPDVAQCVRDTSIEVKVTPPPAAPVLVDVPFDLP